MTCTRPQAESQKNPLTRGRRPHMRAVESGESLRERKNEQVLVICCDCRCCRLFSCCTSRRRLTAFKLRIVCSRSLSLAVAALITIVAHTADVSATATMALQS